VKVVRGRHGGNDRAFAAGQLDRRQGLGGEMPDAAAWPGAADPERG
jgi:hypothetical protein